MVSYYVAKDGKQDGPFEEAEILRRIEAGVFSAYDLCWREGMVDWRPIAAVLNVKTSSPPPIPPTDTGRSTGYPLFLHISVGRLILMSILSFSLYEAYWIYKNWRYVKERDNLTIRPLWRGVFGIFFCHSLLRRIHADEEARAIQQPSFSASGLATGWVILFIIANIVSSAPSIEASIVSAFIPSFLCLVPVQNYINAVTKKRSPSQPMYGWSSGHIVCLLFGIVVWGLLLVGLGAE